MRIVSSSPKLPAVQRGRPVELNIDGYLVQAFEGETVAAVLLAENIFVFGHKHKTGRPAGVYCGMGVCYECLVKVNGVANIRACQTPVSDKMTIETNSQVKP
jgi:sarcosine oxidase subunit alpha